MRETITTKELTTLCDYIFEICGIALDETKGYLLESRLGPIVRQVGCKDFVELVQRARNGNDRTLMRRIVEAITTRETLFFRDSSPFTALSLEVLPDLIQRKSDVRYDHSLRIWSAACSTGQEPYSIAITLFESIPDIADWDISILATDISETAIVQAELGLYSDHEMSRGIQPRHQEKHFCRTANGWQIDESIGQMVRFQRFNLHDSFAAFGHFDIIFCRNVAIYFSAEGRRSLFHRLAQSLNPGGALFAGSSESLSDLGDEFAPCHAGDAVFYRPNSNSICA
jgi:chemotaxis protein methyltransferase CheR